MTQPVSFANCPPGPFLRGDELLLKTANGAVYRIQDGMRAFPPAGPVKPVNPDDLFSLPF